MANITLWELNFAGSQLFQASESFMDDLNKVEAIAVYGGDNSPSYNSGYSFGSYVSTFNKLIEAFVDVYAIQLIFKIATTSFSDNN